MAYLPDNEITEIAKEINKKGGKPVTMSPKKLLEHFGTSRRKTHVKWWIDKGLRELKLKTEPDYKTAYLYGEITLKREKDAIEQEDFVQRVRLLDAANRPPKSVSKNDSIEKAMTLMMSNDFSQLPVMNSPDSKRVDGLISWHSIGWTTAKGKEVKKVQDCMKADCMIISYDTPILEAIHTIKENEVVLVQKLDQSISGLLTVTDIADEFFELAEPFLLIGQIETSIRVLLEDKFTVEELREIKYGDDERPVDSVSDLTFNEYIELMRKGENWSKIQVPLDKVEFTKKLVEVRDIRNDVMHFSSDNLDPEQQQTLKLTAQFLKEILTK